MNTSIISHHLFVAALARERPAANPRPPAGPSRPGPDATRTGPVRPSAQMLAALAARPWVNWPFASAGEEPSAS